MVAYCPNCGGAENVGGRTKGKQRCAACCNTFLIESPKTPRSLLRGGSSGPRRPRPNAEKGDSSSGSGTIAIVCVLVLAFFSYYLMKGNGSVSNEATSTANRRTSSPPIKPSVTTKKTGPVTSAPAPAATPSPSEVAKAKRAEIDAKKAAESARVAEEKKIKKVEEDRLRQEQAAADRERGAAAAAAKREQQRVSVCTDCGGTGTKTSYQSIMPITYRSRRSAEQQRDSSNLAASGYNHNFEGSFSTVLAEQDQWKVYDYLDDDGRVFYRIIKGMNQRECPGCKGMGQVKR